MSSKAASETPDHLSGTLGAAAEVPLQHTLDEQLRSQRLLIIRIYSLGLSVFSGLWCVAFVYCVFARGLEITPQAVIVNLHVALLTAAGIFGFRWCGDDRLHAATYAVVSALMLMATANLALISNAEGTGFVTYCVAAGVAALVLEGREWRTLAVLFVSFSLAGTVLHTFPVVEQIELPRWLQVAAIFGAALGLAYPAGLFWLFSANLTASRSEAWAQARRVAEVNNLLAERNVELERRKEQLEAKNRELADFLYVVSHDLRAPLINLEGFSRSLEESLGSLDRLVEETSGEVHDRWPALREEIGESLGFILRGVAKMDFLVKGLIELSRIDSRPQRCEPVDLNRTVAGVVDSLRYLINGRGISLRIDPLPIVRGDPVRLNQVFGNLIDNAIKYMKPEGPAEIHVGCRTNGKGPLFFVKDSGKGIRTEDQSKVFRLFARLEPHASSGEGLGLTAVKKIVERSGGKIWVESEVGNGSTFWFVWPQNGGLEVEDDDVYRGAHQNLAG